MEKPQRIENPPYLKRMLKRALEDPNSEDITSIDEIKKAAGKLRK